MDKSHDEGVDEGSLVSYTTTRRVMKHFLQETKTVSNEAVTCLSKATELFMLHFVAEVSRQLDRPGNPREVRYDDIVRVVQNDIMCEFLSELIPNVSVEEIQAHSRGERSSNNKRHKSD